MVMVRDDPGLWRSSNQVRAGQQFGFIVSISIAAPALIALLQLRALDGVKPLPLGLAQGSNLGNRDPAGAAQHREADREQADDQDRQRRPPQDRGMPAEARL